MQDVVRNRSHHIYNEDIYNKYIREVEEYSFLGDEIDMPDFYLKKQSESEVYEDDDEEE